MNYSTEVSFLQVKQILDRLVNASDAVTLKFIHGNAFAWETRDQLLNAAVERDGQVFKLISDELVGTANGKQSFLVRILTSGLDLNGDGIDEYPRMPYRGNAEGEYASEEDLELIVAWIQSGCLE